MGEGRKKPQSVQLQLQHRGVGVRLLPQVGFLEGIFQPGTFGLGKGLADTDVIRCEAEQPAEQRLVRAVSLARGCK